MKSFESFRAARWIRTLNLVLQAVLFVTLFAGLNYVALHYAWRFDLSRYHRYSLSPETLSYLRNLTQPVRIVVTLDKDSDNPEVAQAYTDVHDLLREYAYAAQDNGAGKITVDYLNVYEQHREAEQLGLDQPNVIMLLCGGRRRVVGLDELYRVRDRKKQAFTGEAAFTAALLDVSSPDRKKIYFLVGHGEMRPDDVDPVRGLSVLSDALRERNFSVDLLDLAIAKKIPDDAALLIDASPQGRFQPFEQELLRQYLSNHAGRLILLLDPARQPGLDGLLADWGVLVDDDVIYDTSADYLSDSGDLILRYFQPHPITQSLINYQIPVVVGPARSVRPDPGRPLDDGLNVTTLIATDKTAWGERSYRLPTPPEYTPGVDLPGPLSVLVVSERVTANNLPFSVRGGRLVVFGASDLIGNNRLATGGNQALILNTVNWCVDRDTQLNIPPRPIERYQLSLSREELARLRLGLLFLLPAAAALLGLIVYWTRRR